MLLNQKVRPVKTISKEITLGQAALPVIILIFVVLIIVSILFR